MGHISQLTPILFEANETNFTTHNGLGYITNLRVYKVTQAMNGEFELYLEYPIGGSKDHYFEEFQKQRIVSARPNPYDPNHLFRIYDIEKSSQGHVLRIYARSHLFDLGGYVTKELKIDEKTGQEAMNSLKSHINAFETSKPITITFSSNITTKKSVEWKFKSVLSCIMGEENSLVSDWGAQIKMENFKISALSRVGSDTGNIIRYGKNITGVEVKTSTKDVITAIIPYSSTYNSKTSETTPIIGTVRKSPKFDSYPVAYYAAIEFSETEYGKETTTTDKYGNTQTKRTMTKAHLDSITANWFSENPGVDEPDVNVEVDLIDLSGTEDYAQFKILEQIQLGDTITVYSEHHKIDVEAQVIKVEYDGLTGKNTSVEIGNYKKNTYDDQRRIIVDIIDNTIDYVMPDILKPIVHEVMTVQSAANQKNKIFRGVVEPVPNETTVIEENDLWYKPILNDDGSVDHDIYQWELQIPGDPSSGSWKLILGTSLFKELEEEIDDARERLENSLPHFGENPPLNPEEGTLWYKPTTVDGEYDIFRWTGTKWDAVIGTGVSEEIADAIDEVMNKAKSRNRTFRGPTAPTGTLEDPLQEGDLWYKSIVVTVDGTSMVEWEIYRWSSAGSGAWMLTVSRYLNADNVIYGTIDASKIAVINLSASNITTGTLDADNVTITNLTVSDSMLASDISASKIVTGTLDASKVIVSNLSAGSLTTGTLDASLVTISNLTVTDSMLASGISATKITTGILDASNVTISNLDAGSITTGTLDASIIKSTGIEASNLLIDGGTASSRDNSYLKRRYKIAEPIADGEWVTVSVSMYCGSFYHGLLFLSDNTMNSLATAYYDNQLVPSKASGDTIVFHIPFQWYNVSPADPDEPYLRIYATYQHDRADTAQSTTRINWAVLRRGKIGTPNWIPAATEKVELGALGATIIEGGSIKADLITAGSGTFTGTIEANSGKIAGWNIGTNITTGTGSNYRMIAGATASTAFLYCGDPEWGQSKFRVSIQGQMRANWGSIGPLTISAEGLTYASASRFQISPTGYLRASGVSLSGSLVGSYHSSGGSSGGIFIDCQNSLTRIKASTGGAWQAFDLITVHAYSAATGSTRKSYTVLGISNPSGGGTPPAPPLPGIGNQFPM